MFKSTHEHLSAYHYYPIHLILNYKLACRDFCEEDQQQQLTEIHFVDPNMKVANTFHDELCKMFGDSEVQLVSESRPRPRADRQKPPQGEQKAP